MTRPGGSRRRRHRPAPSQVTRPLATETKTSYVQHQLYGSGLREKSRLRRILGWIAGLFRRRRREISRPATRPKSRAQGRRRPRGIEACGTNVGCSRNPLADKAHCHKHAPQHAARLRRRAHRKRVRAQKQKARQ